MEINELIKECYSYAKSQGFHDRPRTFGENIALLHSEVSEALEAYRDFGEDDAFFYFQPIINDPHGRPSAGKPQGIGSELADVFIRLCDICGQYRINLEDFVRQKMNYNATRPYRHGNKFL